MNQQSENSHRMRSAQSSLIAQSSALLLGRGAGLLFSFAVPLILVRVLDQSVFGAYKQYFLIGITVAQMAALGLPWSLYYFVPGGGQRRGEWVGTTLFASSTVGLAVLGVGIAIGPTVARWLNSPALGAVMPHLSVYAALMLMTQFCEDIAVVEQRPKTAALVVVGSELVRAGVLVIAVVSWGTLTAIAWASIVYAGSRAAFLIVYSIKLYGRSLFTLRIATLRRLLQYAIPFGLAVPLESAQTYLHYYFVAAVTDPSIFAVYAVGCFQIPLVHVVYTAVADVALVRSAALSKAGDVAEMRRVFASVLRVLGIFFIPLYVFVAIWATAIIEVLFTAQYQAAAPIFVVFSLMVFGQSADHVILRAHAKTRFILGANGVGLIVSGFLLVPLYSYFGLVGAAMSYILGLLTLRVVGLVMVGRLLSVSLSELVPFSALLRTGGCALFSGFSAWLVARSLGPLPSVLLGAPLFGVLYAALAWRAEILTATERARLVKHLRRIMSRLGLAG